jgi:hypothetical protein
MMMAHIQHGTWLSWRREDAQRASMDSGVAPQKATRLFALTKLQKAGFVMNFGPGLGNLNILLSSTSRYPGVKIVFQKWHRAARQLLDIDISSPETFLVTYTHSKICDNRKPSQTGIPMPKSAGRSPTEPWRFVHCHNHFAEWSDAIPLAAALSLKDKL